MVLVVILLIYTLMNTMLSGIRPVISLYVTAQGAAPAEISFFIAAYALLPALLAVQIGRWTDRYGIRRMVMLGNSSLLLGLILSAIYPSFIMFVLQQVLIGIGFSILLVSLQKRVGSLDGNLDRTIANFMLAGALGAMLGPVLSAPLYDHFGYLVSVYANIILISIAFISALFISKADWEVHVRPETQASKRTDVNPSPTIWVMMRDRNLRNAIIAGGLLFSSRDLFWAYFPLLAEEMGISATMIGFLLSLSGLTALIIRFGQSALVKKFGRMNVLTWSLYISGLVYFLTPFSPWIVVLVVLVGILGGGLGLGQPLSLAFAIEVSPPERRGEVLGLRVTANRVSQLSIPLIFGGIGGLAGVTAVFLASGAVLGISGYLTRKLPSDSQQDHHTIRETL